MPLSVGDKFGHYEVLSLLGHGGMGEVYRARDATLKRDVALKVLAAAFLRDPERMARFQREAEVLASLDHANIGHIHGIADSEDSRGLVLALIEGPTLAGRIEAGPIPLDEAIAISKQIADALEYAHDRGVVHRDLKPANIKITPDGVVKVLDFGLAKVLEDEPPPSSLANSPTLTVGHTRAGVILGTAAYMSPEQAVGRAADRRSDIFSFGAVLYEMLTGQRAFRGAATPDVLEAVVKNDPDWTALPANTPPYLRRLLIRTLAKDRKQRLQAAGEARIILANPEPVPEARAETQAASAKLAWAMAAVLAIVAAVVSFIHFREKPPAAELIRFELPAPEKVTLLGLRLSPDGRRLAFSARTADRRVQIWIRSLEALEAHPFSGTEGVTSFFWSPDSGSIGFSANNKLKRMEVSGGSVQTVCDLPAAFRGGAWAPGGAILFATQSQPLMQVPEAGGTLVPVIALDPASQSAAPSFLPDGRHFIYVRGSEASNAIYLGSLDAKPEQQSSKPLAIVPFPNFPVYSPSPDPGAGYVLFTGESSLMALPFNLQRLEPSGAPVSIAEGSFAGPAFSASSTGILAFRTGATYNSSDSHLLWFDRQGKQLGQLGPPDTYANVRLSPDGRLLLVDHRAMVTDGFSSDHLWIADRARGIFSRVNPGLPLDYSGVLSPDGRAAFTYYGEPGGSGDIYVRLANGAGAPEPLVKSAIVKHPNDWSLDGRYLIYDEHTPRQKEDLWIVPMFGKDHKPVPFLATPADETDGAFSPDTKWIAYSSDEAGRREVYVQGFVPDHVPAAGIGKWQISSAGGAKPRWRRDGKEIYYIAGDGKMMAVPVKSTATTFEPGVAVPLFDTHATGFTPYDVAPDGRFLINTVMEEASTAASSITVVLNWTVGLKK